MKLILPDNSIWHLHTIHETAPDPVIERASQRITRMSLHPGLLYRRATVRDEGDHRKSGLPRERPVCADRRQQNRIWKASDAFSQTSEGRTMGRLLEKSPEAAGIEIDRQARSAGM